MGVLISGRTTGQTTCELVHGPSGATLYTDAPKDNGGRGELFSPTDLCGAALGACGITIMNMFANARGIPVQSMDFVVEKIMTAVAPRKIAELRIAFRIATNCSAEDFEKVVAAGKVCPVRLTLGESVVVTETYERVSCTAPA